MRPTHQNTEAKSGGAGGHVQLPTRNVLWALRLPGMVTLQRPGAWTDVPLEKPHSGRVDSISHRARTWKEGLESWGPSVGQGMHSPAHLLGCARPGAGYQGQRERNTNSSCSEGLKYQVLCYRISH